MAMGQSTNRMPSPAVVLSETTDFLIKELEGKGYFEDHDEMKIAKMKLYLRWSVVNEVVQLVKTAYQSPAIAQSIGATPIVVEPPAP
jgi:hypothetical protein